MIPASKKIVKAHGKETTPLEVTIAQEIANVEVSNAAIKKDLQKLYITGARQVEVATGQAAYVIFVPFKLFRGFKAIQKTLTGELEKRFSGHPVVFVAQRTMLPLNFARSGKFTGPRPRSRTLKVVQEAILDDLVAPAEIVGKRIRVRTDGSKLLKVHLSAKDQTAVESKLDAFAAVYKAMCNKDVSFEFPVTKD